MMYFGEDIRKAIKKEDDICMLKALKIPAIISDIVINWDEQYRKEFIELIKKGEEYRYAFSMCINTIMCEKLYEQEAENVKLNKQIDGLLELNKQLMENFSSEFDELEELRAYTKTLNAYNSQLLSDLNYWKRLLDDKMFNGMIERDKLKDANLDLEAILKMKDSRIKELKQEVNDCHWFGRKPYNL